MTWPLLAQFAVLLTASGIAIWMAIIAFSRPHVPGGRAFGWLNLAVAQWCLAAGFHAFDQTLDFKIIWAQLQYVGIIAVPPLWLLFASDYARMPWSARRSRRRAIWIVPVLTFIAVATNDSHHLYWSSVSLEGRLAVYRYGPLFWVAVTYNYILLVTGTVTLLRGLRLFHRAYRSQTAALVAAALFPWLGNLLYLSGAFPKGFDATPLMFAVSGLLFLWGLYAHQLFDVVPTARAAVFERLTDAVFVLDRAYRVVDANTAAVDITTTAREPDAPARDVIGRHPSELLDWWKELPEAPALDAAEPLLVPAGESLYEVRLTSFVDGRGYGGKLLWVRDATARRKAEHDRLLLEARLREQEKVESLTVIAGGLAHDFNNLLTAVLGNADYLIATSPEGSERRASAEAIATGAQHAADLVSQIVAYSGQGRTTISPVSIEDAVGDVLRAFSRTIGERALVTHESQRELPSVPGDLVQIRQAVLALLANAVDAVSATHGSVEVLTGSEMLDAAALSQASYSAAAGPGEFVFVDVKDDGPGIPADVIPRMFEPFFSTRDMGRGLGLAAVHGIVRSHKGAVRVWTAPGQGTRMRIWWPMS
ncbi:MAG: ATP-binding protein [Acidobacteriota bacterium]|nr:ATP-binding protein [Acidobacteriota bacterium]